MKKQLVSILFALCMVLCLVPLAAFAEGETEKVQGVTDQTGLFNAMAAPSVTTVKLEADIYIGATLTVDREVKLDLNGHVLQMASSNSSPVIEVKKAAIGSSIGNLTLADSDSNAVHKFTPNTDGLWVLDEENGTKTVNGGVITGGKASDGGGVHVATGSQLTMTGGNIIGCSAECGGGVYIDSGQTGKFSMSGGSIAGCVASNIGGGVCASGTFQMSDQAVIRSCTVESTNHLICGGGVYVDGSFEMSGKAKIEGCQAISESAYGEAYMSTAAVDL